uniref:CARD domain-containing protein n=1 Tax=Branchiostoma floridae TaxID=7739 RepID=C3YX03_BRAFL|eukprot:XP_002599385.1 hypothetical protein BRAFLDRAFT_64255 [Branchiostoma floridae]
MAAESTLLIANREELVKNIRFVEPFLDKLLQTNQLTGEESEVVRSGKTPQDRARALIDLVGTKGQDAFGHFRHALKETNPELADILHRCTEHNEKIKLHCDDCVQLLCRTCNKEGHRGHSVSSIVADASAIRREVTAFVRDNRKSLKNFKASASDVESRQNVLMDIERRKNELKAIFIAKVESEFEWCKDQLGVLESVGSPAASISSVATTESELSGRNRSDTESQCSPTAKIRRAVLRNHPYSRVDHNERGSHPRSLVWVQHLARISRMSGSLREMIFMYLPPPPSVGFTPPTSLSPSQSPSQDPLPTSSSPSPNLSSSPTSPGLPFTNYSPSARTDTPIPRSPLSSISFSDGNSPTQVPHNSAPRVHAQRESSFQPTSSSHLVPGWPPYLSSSPPTPLLTGRSPPPPFPSLSRYLSSPVTFPPASSISYLRPHPSLEARMRDSIRRDRDICCTWPNLVLGKMASELEKLKSNRTELVAKIRFVKPFLDRLLQYGEIVEEEYYNTVAEKTPHDQARALLDLVAAKGRGAFRHFREHLKKVNPELEEVLHRCGVFMSV